MLLLFWDLHFYTLINSPQIIIFFCVDIYGVATNSNWYSKEKRAPPSRPKRHSSRASMDIVAKFGQMGSGLGQFHSPHGFCLSPTEDIVVADTHNHRIQVNNFFLIK